MLNGDKVVLRPVRERNLVAFIDAHTEISNRGAFFPLGVLSEPALRRGYAETGFWEQRKVNRISLVIVPENAPSQRIAERCGFQLEGTARGALFTGGRSV
ncbi:MAG: GNAT family protein, partial [Actinomycetota bacterium]